MKFKEILMAAAACCGLWSAASAGELADACAATLEAEGRDASGCVCLEEEALADPALQEEFMTLGEIADPAARYEAASTAAKAAMDKCTR